MPRTERTTDSRDMPVSTSSRRAVIGYRDEHCAVEGGGKSTETTDRHDLIRRNTYLMCFAYGLGRERVRAAERDPRMLQRHFDR